MQIRSFTAVPHFARQANQQIGHDATPLPKTLANEKIYFGNDGEKIWTKLPFPIKDWMTVAQLNANKRPDKTITALDVLFGALSCISNFSEQTRNGQIQPSRVELGINERGIELLTLALDITPSQLNQLSNFSARSLRGIDYKNSGLRFKTKVENFIEKNKNDIDTTNNYLKRSTRASRTRGQ